MDRAAAIDSAWRAVMRCSQGGTFAAAASSDLYRHVWTRDVGLASLGLLLGGQTHAEWLQKSLPPLVASLECIARHQSELGRIALKIDAEADCAVSENAAGIDSGPWFALAVWAAARAGGRERVARLIEPARRALHWTAHLDVDGTGLIASPEAGDWADMLPHRHHVLYSNVLHVAALRASAALCNDAESELAENYRQRAAAIAATIDRVLAIDRATDAAAVTQRIGELGRLSPEWAITGQYSTRWGDLPFYMPYQAFRTAACHFDLVGNCLAIVFGVADAARSRRILDYADAVGMADPWPSKTLYPPILPGDSDWRDHFRWRNLCLPHHYQNGGAWPFAGALHVAALIHIGAVDRATALCDRLCELCTDDRVPFPEWTHGRTGISMGETWQLWSATGVLLATACVEQHHLGVLAELSA